MLNYTPPEILPIYKSYATVIVNGVQYKNYLETDWNQVTTEDGVTLADLLQSIIQVESDTYAYKGTFVNMPDKTAMEQLYALTDQEIGDTYLIQVISDDNTITYYENYSWGTESSGWVYCGTTNKTATTNAFLPTTVRLFPDTLGEAGQVLVVNADGKSISWGSSDTDIPTHNSDLNAHPDIREAIANLSGSTLSIINATLDTDKWIYNGNKLRYEYIYSPELGENVYFDINPFYESVDETNNILDSGISSNYVITANTGVDAYATLSAKRIPLQPIAICVKAFTNSKLK